MLLQKTYQGKQNGPHAYETHGKNAPKWYFIDAEGMVVGRLATLLAKVITGKHKPTYTSHVDSGDFVVVVNADKVVFTRNKWDQKVYYRHSGWIGGLKETSAREMLQKNPTEILKKAVWGMTGKSALARRQMKKLRIFAGSEHTHQAQAPQALPEYLTKKTILNK
ncbi:MAG: 50S ribosomal protein L13 [Bdellovibrionaceae bacterium]|nr:50S ribosomal protein L13 [Pseudobdellovibrionaceae bacterium]|tara:strand:- start:1116 stop:1610 length:495 start_codon:yes stop_codon:yes gene_type:complete